MKNQVLQEIIDKAKEEKIDNQDDFNRLKIQILRQHKIGKIPSNHELLLSIKEQDLGYVNKILTTKPVRTISGVAPISLMTKPEKCKHGTCIFCPGGPNSVFGNVPQSYTGKEPATRRALRNNFDPYLQVFNRIEQYMINNQVPEKVELIIQGGTFPSYNTSYQNEFVTYALKAMNDFSELFFNQYFNFKYFKEFFILPANLNDEVRKNKLIEKILEIKQTSTLEKEQLRNETAKIRCVALVVETKPDWCFNQHINEMLKLGTTRVELGVQTIYDDVLKLVNRGHTIDDTKKSVQLLKDSFLKTTFHIMPGLPNSNYDSDLNMFKEIFSNQDYKPDSLKVYPCMVMRGTALYNMWVKKQFNPITTKEAASRIVELKKLVPDYCRIMRIQRDIPTYLTSSGVDRTNLRQYIQELMKVKCRCIRCREPKDNKLDYDNVKLKRINYEASNGQEVFLSFEDIKNDLLLGFVRLRIPFKPFRKEITTNSAGIREIHVYGRLTQLEQIGNVQHLGYGTLLMNEAEKIAKEEFDIKKLLVMSGIGVKQYFNQKFGYKKDGCYVSKLI